MEFRRKKNLSAGYLPLFASFFLLPLFIFYFTLISGLFPMVQENKKPTGGIEPPTFRLQSECSTTKLSRRASDMFKHALALTEIYL